MCLITFHQRKKEQAYTIYKTEKMSIKKQNMLRDVISVERSFTVKFS